ncbi:MAG: TIGR03905 family TSCPD domain-containing protein [Clostridia bacterium]|nr:TIGR03905 family TSCPD domain-containing protein [Clostridia bacterium]
MTFTYKTKGVCSRSITLDVEENVIKSVSFEGGCNGNTKGIAALIAGMDVDDAIARLEGTTCGFKSTSCPDQLAQALKVYKTEKGE